MPSSSVPRLVLYCLLIFGLWFPALAADRLSREAVEALEAYAVYKMARYPEAYARFLALAQKNNIQGMLNVANMLQSGQGVSRDAPAALEWYRQAAEAGSAIGMFYTGLAYLRGTGTAVNSAQARFWLQRAAAAGSSEAQLALGKLLLDDGFDAEARQWIERAARAGDVTAARYLAALGQAETFDHAIGTIDRALIDAAWDAIDRAAQNRNAPGAVHYLAHDAEIRVRLPGAQNWVQMNRSGLREFWQQTFDRAQAYSIARGDKRLRREGARIVVESVIDESFDHRESDLRLEETARVNISGDRVIIDRLTLVIKRR